MCGFLFNQSQLKAGTANQLIQQSFLKRPIIGQLNIQALARLKKKSNIPLVS